MMNELNDSNNEIDFDFDEWMEVYKTDPDMFEKMRQDLIESTIKQAPIGMRRRLNGLQWQIDTEIKLAKNPLDGCIKIYEMMMDSVYEPNGLLDALSMTKEDITVSVPNVVKLKEVSRIGETED
jgi:hypothetical protein